MNIIDNKSIILYPNPVNEYCSIKNNEPCYEDYYITIYNSQGTVVKRCKVSNILYIGDLKPGIYLIELLNNSGIQITKIIKR